MTAPLQAEYKAIDPIVWAIAFYRPLGSANAIGAKRWDASLPKPYRWPSVPSQPRKMSMSAPVVRIHTLAGTYTDAAREANRTDDRTQVLVDYPGYAVTLPSGLVVRCMYAEILEAAHEEPYAAETVATRFVSEYRFGFSFVAA